MAVVDLSAVPCRSVADLLIRQGGPGGAGFELHSGDEGLLSCVPEVRVGLHDKIAVGSSCVVLLDTLRVCTLHVGSHVLLTQCQC